MVMAGMREVAFDQVLAMGGIEPGHGRIDDGRQRPGRCLGQAPEHGDGEELFLPLGQKGDCPFWPEGLSPFQRAVGDCLAFAIVERDGKRGRVDEDALDLRLFAQQEAERFRDQGREAVDFRARSAKPSEVSSPEGRRRLGRRFFVTARADKT